MGQSWKPRVTDNLDCLFGICSLCELLMSKWVVGIMILVVIAMFWKGVEVLGPSNTNRDVLYEGPKKTVEQRWQAAQEWMDRKRENQSK